MKILLTLAMIVGVFLLLAPLPAQGAGAVEITTPTLPAVADVLDKLNTPGVREVEIRGLSLTRPQLNDSFLSADPNTNVLVQVGGQLRPGQEVEFRTADGQRFRVKNDDGQLRVRLRDVVVQDRTATANFFSANGFGRVEIRGSDAAGNRIRMEVRNGIVKKDEIRADRSGRGREGTSATINNERAADRGRDLDHSLRGRDRAALEGARPEDRMLRVERPERLERVERPERLERAERPERIERVERPERIEHSGRH